MGKMGPVNLHLTHLLSSAPLVTRLFSLYAPQGAEARGRREACNPTGDRRHDERTEPKAVSGVRKERATIGDLRSYSCLPAPVVLPLGSATRSLRGAE